jgi:hypothetical protein
MNSVPNTALGADTGDVGLFSLRASDWRKSQAAWLSFCPLDVAERACAPQTKVLAGRLQQICSTEADRTKPESHRCGTALLLASE